MPSRHYLHALVFILLNCATVFRHQSELEKGLKSYHGSNFREAAEYFSAHYIKYPDSETTLYYLCECYKKLDQPDQEARILEQLVKLGSTDSHVCSRLFQYYRKTSDYRKLLEFLSNMNPQVESTLNESYVLTRRLYAEIVSGAAKKKLYADPTVFAISEKYIPLFPDGKFYENDTISNGNLIILLDRLVDPSYPKEFFKMTHMPSTSFLYIPYMRLVNIGILKFDTQFNPAENAAITVAAKAITALRSRGIFD